MSRTRFWQPVLSEGGFQHSTAAWSTKGPTNRLYCGDPNNSPSCCGQSPARTNCGINHNFHLGSLMISLLKSLNRPSPNFWSQHFFNWSYEFGWVNKFKLIPSTCYVLNLQKRDTRLCKNQRGITLMPHLRNIPRLWIYFLNLKEHSFGSNRSTPHNSHCKTYSKICKTYLINM